MPKIVINEVDLTRASLQPAATDIVFVPGLSCKADATTDLTYCETVADFEKVFGTHPHIMSVDRYYEYTQSDEKKVGHDTYTLYKTVGSANVSTSDDFEKNFNTYIFKNTTSKVSDDHYAGTLSSFYKSVVTFADGIAEKNPSSAESGSIEGINEMLEKCGLFIDGESSDPTSGKTGYKTQYLVFNYDLSYVYAKELLMAGIPVVYKVVDSASDTTYEGLLGKIKSYFTNIESKNGDKDLLDKGEFSIKYITSGAYPSVRYYKSSSDVGVSPDSSKSFYSNMLKVAYDRGDSVALVDAIEGTSSSLSDLESEKCIDPADLWSYATNNLDKVEHAEYGAMFAPWGLYDLQASYKVVSTDSSVTLPGLSEAIMPASFGYLLTLAKDIQSYNNWLAVAGTVRGQVPRLNELYTTRRLSNTLANAYQPRNGATSINAITNIKPYGLTIWGNRTLKNNVLTSMGGEDGLVATSFLNIRNMVSDIKKVVYNAAKTLMFEQNSNQLWLNFLSMITPHLDQLQTGQGISSYKVIKQETDEKAKLKAIVRIYPLYAIEDFEVTVELADEEVTVF